MSRGKKCSCTSIPSLCLILGSLLLLLSTQPFVLAQQTATCSARSANLPKLSQTNSCDSLITSMGDGRAHILNETNIKQKLEALLSAFQAPRDVKHFIQVVSLVEQITKQDKNQDVQACFRSTACELLNNCDYPISMAFFPGFERVARFAPRLAAILSAFSSNENADKKQYLVKSNLNAQLKLILRDNKHIYDAKVIFRRNNKNSILGLHAIKDYRNGVSVGEYKIEPKDSAWYSTWSTISADQTRKLQRQDVNAFNDIKFVSGAMFDCEKLTWYQVVSVPFIWENGEIRGVVAISISLEEFDLEQCGTGESNDADSAPDDNNPFMGTDECNRINTRCENQKMRGFVIGSYKCQCKDGFYRTNSSVDCVPCSAGCDTCVDDSPCQIVISKELQQICLLINMCCILICLMLIGVVSYRMWKGKIIASSSPEMLLMVLFGAIVCYCEIIPMQFEANYWTCTAAQILQLEGFLLVYGALVLKTWRECKLFYVRSVKNLKITNEKLMKRLALIMLGGTMFLVIWALRRHDSPQAVELTDINGLKYTTCTITEWNYMSMLIQIAVLSCGVMQAIHVRRASIAFKETKLITLAIFNECFFKIIVISTTFFIFQNENLHVYVFFPFMHNFLRVHLTITVMLLLIFVYKIYTIAAARKKPYQSNQSALLNNFTIANNNDGDAKNLSICEEKETEKEKDLKQEIQRLCRQLEETRSLSMRIANPHLLTKKSRFINYPTKKTKAQKYLLPLPLDANSVDTKVVDPLLSPKSDSSRAKAVEEESVSQVK